MANQAKISREFHLPHRSVSWLVQLHGGVSADIIGRKLAFNTSLFSCAVFVLIAAGMPIYIFFSAL
jgi:hypothetical protein